MMEDEIEKICAEVNAEIMVEHPNGLFHFDHVMLFAAKCDERMKKREIIAKCSGMAQQENKNECPLCGGKFYGSLE